MTPSASRVTDEIVEKAWVVGVKDVSGAAQPHPYRGPWDKPALRAALEAVWPEPTFTHEEVTELIFAAGHSGRGGNLRALESAYAKLLEMERANHA